MNVTPEKLTTFSIMLLALGLALAGALMVIREFRRVRSDKAIGRAIRRGTAAPAASQAEAEEARPVNPAWADQDLPAHWLHTKLGRMLVADEDRRLIDQCGFPSTRAQLAFLVVRIALALLMPLLMWLFLKSTGFLPQRRGLAMAFAFVIGFLLPKWVLSYSASGRRERVAQELPLFVDLLRLLQGVGLSLDQSLQIMAADFGHVMRILASELHIANRQYSQGRTREHSLQRLATLYDNNNLAGLVALLVQVDRHGGAVQEPLQKFSDRLREHRRMELKERIGKITVKMTGVMVTTLLPALVIVTAGPGFLAVIRSLGAMTK
ncbi:type II secretion system F family protein [Variovorax sp. UMC13]|uniref:type II secretion system F family protein n=1 Tax=Variovorax sp. UMC13 TaxID=1862326 RepID=UPI0016021C85|nr:type II secretion system F family protein [Variovorax sp. UMC13]MBB1599335.1 secretion system protein [Variovorax sp. UMC13]